MSQAALREVGAVLADGAAIEIEALREVWFRSHARQIMTEFVCEGSLTLLVGHAALCDRFQGVRPFNQLEMIGPPLHFGDWLEYLSSLKLL